MEPASTDNGDLLKSQNQLSKTEFKQYLEQKESEYGTELASQISPTATVEDGVTLQGQNPGDETKVDLVGTWNADSEVRNNGWPNVLYANVDNTLQLYRSTSKVDGRYIYFAWHWSFAKPQEGSWYIAYMKNITNNLNCWYDHQILGETRPDNLKEVRNKEYNFQASMQLANGSAASVGGNYYLSDGVIYPNEKTAGRSGSFEVKWEMDNKQVKSPIGLNGLTVIRSTELYDAYNSDGKDPHDDFGWNPQATADAHSFVETP